MLRLALRMRKKIECAGIGRRQIDLLIDYLFLHMIHFMAKTHIELHALVAIKEMLIAVFVHGVGVRVEGHGVL